MNSTLIENALASYHAIAEHLATIEQAMHGQDCAAILALSGRLVELQEQVKADDIALLDKLETDPAFRREPRLMELVELIRHIHHDNERVTSQLRSIMVVYRDELLKLKNGNTALQGYRPQTARTGKRISIAN
jgi:hypothetical protein